MSDIYSIITVLQRRGNGIVLIQKQGMRGINKEQGIYIHRSERHHIAAGVSIPRFHATLT